MSRLHHTTSVESAPVHSTTAIKLALCMLLGLVAALVDLVAVVGRRGALAGVPLLIVFTVSGAVPRQPVGWWLFASAAGGFLILLALDSSDDLHRWGHYVPRQYALKSRTAETGQRIAVAAIALAVILPLFVPSDSRNWLANLFHNGKSDGLDTGIGRVGGYRRYRPVRRAEGPAGPQGADQAVRRDGARPATARRSGRAHPAQLFYARSNVLSRFTGDGWSVGSQGQLESISGSHFDSSPGVSFPPDTHRVQRPREDHEPAFEPAAVRRPHLDRRARLGDEVEPAGPVARGQHDLARRQLRHAGRAAGTDGQRARERRSATDPSMNAWLELPPVADYVRTLVASADVQCPDAVRQGAGDQRLLHRSEERLHLQPRDAARRHRRRARRLPAEQVRLLPAVRRGGGCDAACGRRPVAHRARVHARSPVQGRHVHDHDERRALLGRGVLRGHRLDPVRPDADRRHHRRVRATTCRGRRTSDGTAARTTGPSVHNSVTGGPSARRPSENAGRPDRDQRPEERQRR